MSEEITQIGLGQNEQAGARMSETALNFCDAFSLLLFRMPEEFFLFRMPEEFIRDGFKRRL